MTQNRWPEILFDAIDGMDISRFAAFLAPQCTFRFGNMPTVCGRDNIELEVAGFVKSLRSISHSLAAVWEPSGATICHGQVTYTRRDLTTLTVPFANILLGEPGSINTYLIFVDISEL